MLLLSYDSNVVEDKRGALLSSPFQSGKVHNFFGEFIRTISKNCLRNKKYFHVFEKKMHTRDKQDILDSHSNNITLYCN